MQRRLYQSGKAYRIMHVGERKPEAPQLQVGFAYATTV